LALKLRKSRFEEGVFSSNLKGVALITFIVLALKYLISTSLMIDFLLFAILVYGYDITAGHMKYRSLGHTLYYGLGLYGVGLFVLYVSKDLISAFLFSVVFCLLAGLLASIICVRKGGAYSVLLNLSLCLIIYWLILEPFSFFTKGNDGIWFLVPSLFRNVEFTFYFLLVTFFLLLLVFAKIISSPFGYLIRAIGENETRLKFLGYNTNRIKVIAFVISVMISGLSGSLRAVTSGYVSPTMLYPLPAASQILFASLLGGEGTLYGPFLGSFVLVIIRNMISLYFWGAWEIIMGLLLVITLFVRPAGLYSSIARARAYGVGK